jgi:ATP-dependent Clp protease protease subunit
MVPPPPPPPRGLVWHRVHAQIMELDAGQPQAASAAAVLLAAGAHGKRLALPNARVLIHQPASGGGGQGQASDIEIQAREIMRMREWLEETLAKHSGKPVAQVNKDIDRDKILTAQEALEYGLIDQVLTSRKG